MKKYVWSAILFCVAFFGMKAYESYASINTVNYILRGEPNAYYATFSTNAGGTGTDSLQVLSNGCSVDYILRGEPNTYYTTFSTNADGTGMDSLQVLSNGCSVDYILRGEPNTYYATFSAISNDIDSYNSEEMHSDDIVIAEPTPLPKQ